MNDFYFVSFLFYFGTLKDLHLSRDSRGKQTCKKDEENVVEDAEESHTYLDTV